MPHTDGNYTTVIVNGGDRRDLEREYWNGRIDGHYYPGPAVGWWDGLVPGYGPGYFGPPIFSSYTLLFVGLGLGLVVGGMAMIPGRRCRR